MHIGPNNAVTTTKKKKHAKLSAYITVFFSIITFLAYTVGLCSVNWSLKIVKGKIVDYEGLFLTCTEIECKFQNEGAIRKTAHFLALVMSLIYYTNVVLQLMAVYSKCYCPTVYTLLYYTSAVIAFMLVLVYPTFLRWSEPDKEIRLDWGYFTFLFALFMMITMGMRCCRYSKAYCCRYYVGLY
ncbi:uncharacterized protein LOC131942109 [Physella acuta]|uniref:uncharacterized protein LOC131942109 n=1 Tax=Physella acuta TaxID=109671 RepID=UPI0027DC8D92|nr:uncharacterized protein LOC131942109 [Physella acuta]